MENLIQNIDIGLSEIFEIISFIIFLCVSLTIFLIKKHVKSYFENNIKDELKRMFNGYKHETQELLENLKNFKEFKESRILIINDRKKNIDKLTLLANFTNKDIKDFSEIKYIQDKETKNYSMIIIDNNSVKIG